jgi:hypothetical protein
MVLKNYLLNYPLFSSKYLDYKDWMDVLNYFEKLEINITKLLKWNLLWMIEERFFIEIISKICINYITKIWSQQYSNILSIYLKKY